MAIGKKLRFEIFRRDNFACRYCGATALSGAVLEVDHLIPRSKGGRDVPRNLLTACEACNLGKSDTGLEAQLLEDVPQDAFRRACSDRGILLEISSQMRADEESSARQILAYLDRQGRGNEVERARWIIEDIEGGDATDDRLAAQAVFNTFFSAECDIRKLAAFVRDLIFFQGLDRFEETIAAAHRAFPEVDDFTDVPPGKFAAVLAEEALERAAREVLRSQSEDAVNEWMAYGEAVYGSDPWGYSDSEKLIMAAKAYQLVAQDGRVFPEMCWSAGSYIVACPNRGSSRVWLSQCHDCETKDGRAAEGHPACAQHTEQLVAGTYVTSDGRSVCLVRTEQINPLSVGSA